MNIIKTSKISKISALSALVLFFGALTMAVPQAHAGGYSYGGGNYGSHGSSYSSNSGCGCGSENSYYGGGSYYPTSSGHSSSASSAASSASTNTNTNVNVNVNVPVTVSGGYVAKPVYSQPIVYNYPTTSYVPTYYNDYTAPTPTYAYTSPAYNYNYNSGYNYGTSYGTTYGNYYGNSLAATCNANTTSANIGQGVTWTSNVTGGSGYYTYSWSGSNNLYGNSSSITATYNTTGTQYAEVTVTSNSGQSVTAQCSNSVVIGGANYSNGNSNGLTIGCAAGASTVHPGTPVTWSVEATGGNGNYTYAWSGTDGLSGSQSSVATTYETTGTKQAVVIVTSSNGMTGSESCTPVSVIGYGGGNVGNGSNGGTTVTPANGNNSGLSAASLFSLGNIPWGWVAVLIIIVLFGTVMYMLFNKSKI